MSRERWRRDLPQFHSLLGLEDGPISLDSATGSSTELLRLSAGWAAQESAADATTELFVLQGDLACEGEAVGCGGYVCLPRGDEGAELRSDGGATALRYLTPDLAASERRVTRDRQEPWLPAAPGAHGVLYKSLRRPDPSTDDLDGAPGGFLRLFMIAPGIADPQQHVHHECWEEVILLRGDAYIGDCGVMGLLSYQANPAGRWHAPFGSHGGALLLVHTDAPMGAPWPRRPFADGERLLAEHHDTSSYLTHAEHADLPGLPHLRP